MSYRRSLEGDAETARQDEDQPDVEGHAVRSGRLAKVKADGVPRPDQADTGVDVDDDDVEGHAVRVKADSAAGPEAADIGFDADRDDVEGHAFKSGRGGGQPS
jgi:hypothetical protein